MSKFLRITGFEEIPEPGLDGHRYKLSFEFGDLVNGQFRALESRSVPVTTSRTLQAVWGQDDAQLAQTSASAAIVSVTNVASSGNLANLAPIGLNTYTAPKSPPTSPRVVAGTVVPVPESPAMPAVGSRFTILSDDIAELRDQINALANDLMGGRLLELPQERAILDVYKSAVMAEEFRNRIQSLATICVSMNKALLGKALSLESTKDIGSIALLLQYLQSIAPQGQAATICDVLKNVNNLRKGYPAHGDNTAEFLPAHDYFKLKYPITEFATAWEKILGEYFRALESLRDVLSGYRARA